MKQRDQMKNHDCNDWVGHVSIHGLVLSDLNS